MANSWTRWTPDHARTVLDELDASGLTGAEFARRRNIHPERIRRWRGRLRRAEQPTLPRLVELVPADPPLPVGILRLRCPSGHVVELDGMDVGQALRLLLAAVAGTPS